LLKTLVAGGFQWGCLPEKQKNLNACVANVRLQRIRRLDIQRAGKYSEDIVNSPNNMHEWEDSMEEKARAHLIVRGRVQGVCFRAETQKAATIFGVSGWVRNKRDGTVEAVVEGVKKDVMSLVNWCNTGPPMSKVKKVDVTWQNFKGEFVEFGIRY
jgi:acylphosphatase